MERNAAETYEYEPQKSHSGEYDRCDAFSKKVGDINQRIVAKCSSWSPAAEEEWHTEYDKLFNETQPIIIDFTTYSRRVAIDQMRVLWGVATSEQIEGALRSRQGHVYTEEKPDVSTKSTLPTSAFKAWAKTLGLVDGQDLTEFKATMENCMKSIRDLTGDERREYLQNLAMFLGLKFVNKGEI